MTKTISELNDSLVDRYVVEKQIGQGGMATVYLARDVRHDRKVAIKVLHPELAAVLGPERFVTEMKVTANLQHPHILPLFDSGTARNQLFYVMPFVEGETLRDKLTREQQLPIDEAIRLTTEVAGALDYAHRHGVVHRDIKPENILLHDGTALVADFGIALAVSNAGGTRLTQTGLSLGTPQYMSPEQATGDKVIDGRTDVYSLGCMMYEMLTGEPPFTGPSSQAIVARVLTEQVRPIRARRDTVSEDLEAAVITAVQKLPADRFPTPGAFAEALRNGGTSSGTSARTAARRSSPQSPASRVWRLVSLVAVAAIVGIAAFLIGGRRNTASDDMQIARQLTFDGNVTGVALSAAGAWLAYVRNNCFAREFLCGHSLLVREVDGTASVPIAADWHTIATGVTWSDDGALLAFVGNKDMGKVALYLADRLGSSKGSIPVEAQAFGFTPDSKMIAIVLGPANHEFLARYDIKTFSRVDSVALPMGWKIGGLAYNHAGDQLAVTATVGGAPLLAMIGPKGEVLDTLAAASRPAVRWAADDAAILSFRTAPGISDDLYRIPVRAGHFQRAEERIILGQVSTGYTGFFDASRTGRVAMLATPTTHQIQVVRLDDLKHGWNAWTRRTGYLEPGSISPNDSLLASTATDNLGDNIYLFTLATGNGRPLTTTRGGYEYARWSPDGKHVVMTRYAGSPRGIILVNVSGGAERMLAPGMTHNQFTWTGPNAITVAMSEWLVTLDTLGVHTDSMALPDSLAMDPREILTPDLATGRLAWWSAKADGIVIADLKAKTYRVTVRHSGWVTPVALFPDGSMIGFVAGDSSARVADRRKNAIQRIAPDGTTMTHLIDVPRFCLGLTVSSSGKWAVCLVQEGRPDVWLADKAGRSGW